MTVTIYHNPRCSKSRQTLELLRERELDVEIIEYLETPPNEQTLKVLLGKLELEPRALMRKKEAIYTELGLHRADLSEADLVKSMSQNPILIERPIVLANGKAALGRPPENVLNIL